MPNALCIISCQSSEQEEQKKLFRIGSHIPGPLYSWTLPSPTRTWPQHKVFSQRAPCSAALPAVPLAQSLSARQKCPAAKRGCCWRPRPFTATSPCLLEFKEKMLQNRTSPLGFFRCPLGQQLGTTKECSESHFPTRKPCRNLAPLQTSSVHSCRLMSTSSSLLLGLVEAPKAPWPCCCHRHVLFPTGADVLLAFHCPHGGTGPVVGGSLLPHPHGPSLAGQGAPGGTRCRYPVAAVPEEAEEEFTPVRAAGVCVNQTSYTSTAVLPAPMLGWQEHREASGQMRGGDGTCGAATATSSWVLTTGPPDPRVWGQPFQPLLNASG